jgi:predicted site-specific integrase-resolvase
MTDARKPPPARTVRGYRMAELCAREGIDRRTGWRWVQKGALKVSRLGPRLGVRVQYLDAADEDEDGEA